MKLLVFGKTGQIANELRSHNHKGLIIRSLGRDEADLSNPVSCSKSIFSEQADIVINLAAFTDVDRAESEEDLANVINAEAPTAMANAARIQGIPFIHVSTDYVFDGEGEKPWQVHSPASPLSAYGRSKLKGEAGVRQSGANYVIMRTSWVFSAFGSNFVKTMLKLSEMRDNLCIVSDQVGGPTAAADIADACLTIAKAFHSGQGVNGTFHFTGSPDISKADFAREIFTQAGLKVVVNDILTSAYPTNAKRPQNSRMDCYEIKSAFGIERPDWRKSLTTVLQDIKEI